MYSTSLRSQPKEMSKNAGAVGGFILNYHFPIETIYLKKTYVPNKNKMG